MKRFFAAFAVSLCIAVVCFGQSGEVNIVPRPISVEYGNGTYRIDRTTKIVASTKEEKASASVVNDALLSSMGFRLDVVKSRPASGGLVLSATAGASRSEGYQLQIDGSGVKISGTPEGLFYGIQTLLQMIPAKGDGTLTLPYASISDQPRFKYRGMHLDVSRHFMPVEFVKKFIDLMSQFKLNTFHWHLTDDQGWRIEIKKYPKLTTVGQYRNESHEGSYSTTFKGDGRPVEGFYTQEQIKDVVAYAKARYVTVIPEIELPGHASAALAAYPELGKGCAAADYKFEVKKTWGIFKEVFCPTDETFKFLDDVLDETIKLFPDSPYIHIGGDEVLKDFWKESPFVQDLMKRENLKDEHEVQSYFIRRMERFVNSKGKKIIGWDEILEGGIAPNATVMSWRGMRGGIEAAKAKHDVIMTPTDFAYLDYGQGDPAFEPLNIGGYVPLEKTYSMNPVPPELTAEEAKYVIGAQANIWTEYLETPAAVEYMAFPRMLALAEVAWSANEGKNFVDFKRRMNAILPRLDARGVNYRIPEPVGLQNVVTTDESVSIALTPAPGTKILYTTDGSTPSDSSLVYDKPVTLSIKDGEVKTLKTIVVNGAGRKSVVYAATVVRGTMREPENPATTTLGLNYRLVSPSGDFAQDPAAKTGETRSIMIPQFEKVIDLKKSFSVQFDGYLRIPADGVYELLIDSTWDTTVVLGDNKMIIDEAGEATRKVKSAIVPMKAGLHKISLRYNSRGGEPFWRFRFGIKGQGLRQAYGGEFVH